MTTRMSTIFGQRDLVVVSRCLVFCLSVTLMSCSSVTGVSSRTQPGRSEKNPAPDGSGIIVIANPYVDDSSLAHAAADEAKAELVKRGYKIVSSEDQAQLVAIPTVETNYVSVTSETVTPIGVPSAAPALQMDRPEMLVNTFDSLPSFLGPKAGGTVKAGGKVLVIEAFDKDAWEKVLMVNELQLPPTWKLRIPLPKSLEPAVEGAAFATSGTSNQIVIPQR
jgi:hypothetical protein